MPVDSTHIDSSLLAADSAAADSLAADSAAIAPPPGIVLVNPSPLHDVKSHTSPAASNSWILLILFALFASVCFKYKSNIKYFTHLFRDLLDVRERPNAFDDTVRETSFVYLLNILCAVSAAVILYVSLPGGGAARSPLLSVLLCLAATGGYCVVLPAIYWVVGDIFSDRVHAKMWMNGFLASQGVLGVALFPVALVSLFYPGARGVLIPVAVILLIIAKLLFISKGFRIFFTKYSSWVTFLYYLCSLEIVPLILTFAAAEYMTTAFV